MEKLWTVFVALFGNRFTSQFDAEVDKSGQWAETLRGVSLEQIAKGLERVRQSGRAWPPTAPEFREICLTEPMPAGMPTLEHAWSEMQRYMQMNSSRRRDTQLSVAVAHTKRKHLDWYNFCLLDAKESFHAFKRAYEATIQDVKSGKKLEAGEAQIKLEQIPLPKVDDAHRKKCEPARAKVMGIFDE